ncbi:MAG: SMC family ATPase [Oscillospiraceae bacterium]|nr:SMC family ATPase [Oscillospiraceae bacterium]
MRPLRLRMKAFGSYLHETKIDFTELGEHPLFLITGATGGGKTTILDAMCFALYGKATGGRRSWEGMRSLSAKPEDETLVEFEFGYRGSAYKWFRSRKEYYSKRADAMKVKDVHECYQSKKDGKWELLCSGSELRVKEQAEQLLGLTCEQFSQVVVLPQGDFLKLLLANSRDKASLLQTLFATERWERLTRRMRDRAGNLSKQAGQNDAARASIVSREGVQDMDGLQEKCRKLAEEQSRLQKSFADAQVKQAQCNRVYDIAAKAADAYDGLKQREKLLNDAAKRSQQAAGENAKMQAALPQAETCRAQAKKLGEQAAARQSALDAARKLDTLRKKIQRTQTQLQQNQKLLEQAEQTQKEAQERWQKGMKFSDGLQAQLAKLPEITKAINMEMQTNAAAAVAAGLQENCPCPVCGSFHHPNPAKPSVRLQELRQMQEKVKTASNTLQKARARLKLLEEQREKARTEAEQRRSLLTDLKNQFSADAATEKAIAEQMQGSATLVELEQTVQKLRGDANKLTQQETLLRRNAENARSRAAAAEEAFRKTKADVTDAQAKYQLAISEYRTQPEVPKDVERPDEKAARQARDAAQQEAGRLAGQAGRAQESLKSAQHSQKQLQKLEQEGKDLRVQYEATGRLADLLSGRTKQKVPIQQFVLGIMLDDILASANTFFSDLSGGRYRLLRKKTPAGGNALGGLDLLVLDAASGGERNVNTLSGGELFLASLSLAFGLSDTVQSYSGAVRLDSLFIDEGFGSLDQETLDTAMNALLRLQKSGRTVGIISHVTELQNVIKKQLVVSRLPDGTSCVQTVV